MNILFTFQLKHDFTGKFIMASTTETSSIDKNKMMVSTMVLLPCRVGSVGSVLVGREFASRPGHTKDHHKNGTNCLPAQARMR